jgi:hypothetical protein
MPFVLTYLCRQWSDLVIIVCTVSRQAPIWVSDHARQDSQEMNHTGFHFRMRYPSHRRLRIPACFSGRRQWTTVRHLGVLHQKSLVCQKSKRKCLLSLNNIVSKSYFENKKYQRWTILRFPVLLRASSASRDPLHQEQVLIPP